MSYSLFQFYKTGRFCPKCGQRLVTMTLVSKRTTQGPLQSMGIPCHCLGCATRYRAVSRVPFSKISWLGPLGRWVWWQTTELEITLQSSE